jgi:hypothetical protein
VAVSTAKHILIFPENKEPQIKFLHQENSHINHWLGKADAVYPKPMGKGKDIPKEMRTYENETVVVILVIANEMQYSVDQTHLT